MRTLDSIIALHIRDHKDAGRIIRRSTTSVLEALRSVAHAETCRSVTFTLELGCNRFRKRSSQSHLHYNTAAPLPRL